MQDDDDTPDETMIEALTILQSRNDATNEFFMKVGVEILHFAQNNNLTVNELCVNLGYMAGTFGIAAVRESPEQYVQASEEYAELCSSAMELGVAMVLDRHEAETQRPNKGPANG